MTKDGITKGVVFIDNGELIFSDKNSDNPHSELTKQILHRMFEKSGLGIYKACEIAKTNHPEFTSAQNIGNKIRRGTLDLLDMIYLAEACGYRISFDQVESIDAETAKVVVSDTSVVSIDDGSIRRIKPNILRKEKDSEKSYKKYVLMGYSAYISGNFGIVTIAGEKADEAAQWLSHNTENIDEIHETALMIKANEDFNVLCRPVASNQQY